MVGRKGSVDRLLWDEFNFMRPEERPRYGSAELDEWLDDFQTRHWEPVSRMKKPFRSHALYVLKYVIPGYDL